MFGDSKSTKAMMGYELYVDKPRKQQATISQCEDVIGESYAPDMRLAVKEWRLREKPLGSDP
jgi:hypothetical protein